MKEEVPGVTFEEQQQEERKIEEQNEEEELVDEFNEIIYKGETLVSKVDGLTLYDTITVKITI